MPATAPARSRLIRARKRKRPMLELRTPRGSRIVVGRSPVENAELTFHVARPSDLWFHAQGVPGAHVILSRDDRGRVPEEDLHAAASLAAFYSKARPPRRPGRLHAAQTRAQAARGSARAGLVHARKDDRHATAVRGVLSVAPRRTR